MRADARSHLWRSKVSGSASPEDACGTSCSQVRHTVRASLACSAVCASGSNLPSSCWGEAGLQPTARRGAAEGNRALRSRAHTSARLMAWYHLRETCASRVRVKCLATCRPGPHGDGAHPLVYSASVSSSMLTRRALAGTGRTVPAPCAQRPSRLACPRARLAPWCRRTTAIMCQQ